ncbi:MAG: hypothetical protein A3G25_15845 [Betaproteobacteria bacterium RIFCSPLOWO2_12_FULL_63_13]|nr:MAG: hypothetical protein A3H32_12580 [Betaproteobacteria bacterium RIFCSPLOWO2_02_FULL_63_19]OGA42953.1 MAG: hypothetical protein A3G25_15845 [Betaproteobacteria bacterium RIFCSPLOWO2_12_FULL_63_13]
MKSAMNSPQTVRAGRLVAARCSDGRIHERRGGSSILSCDWFGLDPDGLHRRAAERIARPNC